MSNPRIPVSTYRIQFSRDFRFKDAEDLVPYLHQLGITDLYSSPRFRPRRGSSHGYDVTHPRRVNPELGSEEEFEDLCVKLKNYDMGLLLDIVPNHMAASRENEWWEDVLEHGPASSFADYFDIDWHPQITKAAFLQDGKVLVPVLGDLYGEVLSSGNLILGLDERGIYLAYYERRFPIDSGTCAAVLEACAAGAASDGLPEASAALLILSGLSRSIPPRENLPPGEGAARSSLCRELDDRLFRLHRDNLETRLAIDRSLHELGSDPARLHRLLDQQAYRLAHWRIASEEINYRRFFDINDLVSLRVELPQIFEARHAALREHVEAGRVTGLRVDHIDGLYDALQYLKRLQALVGGQRGESSFYIVVEKILGTHEALPGDWPVAGTTGYEFLNAVNDLFIDPAGLERLEDEHRGITGNSQPFADLCYECNRLVMRKLFAGEVERLTHELSRIAARHWMARDVPVSELKRALVEVTACLPVYRTYATDRGIADADRQVLGRTLEIARQRMGPSVNIAAWQFLREVLLLEPPDYDPGLGAEYLDFLRRWQQFTGPVMAKGLEDTAFYRNASLISRNEVGGDPLRETPPRSIEQVHEFFLDRRDRWPHSLNTTSTHDTKRSEDVRARINVLSEMPDRWARSLRQWRRLNPSLRSMMDGQEVPSADEEIRIYQTLLGAWPFEPEKEFEFRERVTQFLRKACREAKLHSDWLEPNEAYEEALLRFAAGLIDADPGGRFKFSFGSLWRAVAFHGAWNSLSQLLIKITAPGVPDIYQGTELWTFHLVDPDNRSAVDYAKCREMLAKIREGRGRKSRRSLRELARTWQDGRIKLFVTDSLLDFRRENSDLFAAGSYMPLPAEGARNQCMFAFARQAGSSWALTLAPRTTAAVAAARGPLGARAQWADTAVVLPAHAPSRWTNLFTGVDLVAQTQPGGQALDISQSLDGFPIALLFAKA